MIMTKTQKENLLKVIKIKEIEDGGFNNTEEILMFMKYEIKKELDEIVERVEIIQKNGLIFKTENNYIYIKIEIILTESYKKYINSEMIITEFKYEGQKQEEEQEEEQRKRKIIENI